jgi:hypothetical protein
MPHRDPFQPKASLDNPFVGIGPVVIMAIVALAAAVVYVFARMHVI